jgi:hypothetical protein
MLRITRLNADGRLVLKLEGRLVGPWVGELEACWRGVAAIAAPGEPVWVDLGDVWLVDEAAERQLALMHRAGVRFLTRGPMMGELVREIVRCR